MYDYKFRTNVYNCFLKIKFGDAGACYHKYLYKYKIHATNKYLYKYMQHIGRQLVFFVNLSVNTSTLINLRPLKSLKAFKSLKGLLKGTVLSPKSL